MAFKKAQAEQAALKMGIYGPAGSGKTLTALLLAEGLATASGKRIAFVDTERGTDFYSMTIPERRVHPQGFDFEAIYTRSISDVMKDCKSLDMREYGVVVIDSITHIWKSAVEAYTGKKNRKGAIPFHAWAKIKQPYDNLMQWLLNSPLHVIICGREGVIYENDPETEEIKAVGARMKAEGETPYEMHVLARMMPERHVDGSTSVGIYIEKDRTSVLSGQTILLWTPDGRTPPSTTYDRLAKPLLQLLGSVQAQMPSTEEVAAHDQEALETAARERVQRSGQLREEYEDRVRTCKTLADVDALSTELQPLRGQLHPEDATSIRLAFQAARKRIKGETEIVLERQPGEDEEPLEGGQFQLQ